MIKWYIYFLKNKFLKDSTLLEGGTIITTQSVLQRVYSLFRSYF